MRDILSNVDRWLEQGKSIALATVVETWGSAPRGVGAKMVLTPAGDIAGSVSGGCVEGAVYEAGVTVLETGRPTLLHFGVADEDAWEVGLACGGSIEVFVQPLNLDLYQRLHAALDTDTPVARVTLVSGPPGEAGAEMLVFEHGDHVGSLGERWTPEGIAAARYGLKIGVSGRKEIGAQRSPAQILVEAYPPAPLLVVVGGVHIALALVRIAQVLGYRTVVIDPRRAFGNEARFPGVDRLIQTWPDEAFKDVKLTPSTAVVMLTHDPKIDDPAFMATLASPAFFVGALGSKTTHAKRRQRLKAAGLEVELIDRIYGPVGLDLNGKTPEEIALAIMAQIVSVRNQQHGLPGGSPPLS